MGYRKWSALNLDSGKRWDSGRVFFTQTIRKLPGGEEKNEVVCCLLCPTPAQAQPSRRCCIIIDYVSVGATEAPMDVFSKSLRNRVHHLCTRGRTCVSPPEGLLRLLEASLARGRAGEWSPAEPYPGGALMVAKSSLSLTEDSSDVWRVGLAEAPNSTMIIRSSPFLPSLTPLPWCAQSPLGTTTCLHIFMSRCALEGEKKIQIRQSPYVFLIHGELTRSVGTNDIE